MKAVEAVNNRSTAFFWDALNRRSEGAAALRLDGATDAGEF
jgi:hypothetical protein